MTSASSRPPGTSALAILDLVSRKWIETMLCPASTHVEVQALFIRALERERLLDEILALIDELAPERRLHGPAACAVSVSDNGAQMTSGKVTSAIRVASIPYADNRTICARRVTTQPLLRLRSAAIDCPPRW